MQLLTAIGALTGCGLALFAGQGAGLEAANLYILPFTAGGMGPQSASPYHNHYFGSLLLQLPEFLQLHLMFLQLFLRFFLLL